MAAVHVGGVISAAIEVFLPSLCLHCGAALAGGDSALCGACWSMIAPSNEVACPLCGGLNDRAHAPCLSCDESPPPQGGTAVLAEYAGALRTAIVALKHGRRDELAAPLVRRLAAIPAVAAHGSRTDTVTAVPTHRLHLLRRGHSAAELVARRLAQELQLPFRRTLRRRGLGRQTGHTRAQRLRLRRRHFVPRRRIPGLRVLLVDDVTTTGTTLRRAAEALQTAGARSVFCAVLGRAPDPRRQT